MSAWYCKVGENELGPLTSQQLTALARDGRLQADHFVRRSKDKQWSSAARVKGLFEPVPQSSRPNPPLQQSVVAAQSSLPSFIERSRPDEEHVSYRARLHKWIFVRPFVFCTVMYIAILLLNWVFAGSSGGQRELQLYSSREVLGYLSSSLTIAASWAILTSIAYRYSRIAVTDKRVIGGHSTSSITSRGLPLTKVEKINVSRSLMGKLLGFGTVIVFSTNGSRLRFRDVAAPFAFKKAIEDRQMALMQRGWRVPGRPY